MLVNMCSTYDSETKGHVVTVTEAGTGSLLANILFFPESKALRISLFKEFDFWEAVHLFEHDDYEEVTIVRHTRTTRKELKEKGYV